MSKLKEGYIRYSNQEQRLAAIKQAESLGFDKWGQNDKNLRANDDCIALGAGFNGLWRDDNTEYIMNDDDGTLKEIPLDAKEYDKAETNCGGCMGPCGECENKQVPTIDQDALHSLMEYQFMFQKSQYTKTESEDGTITLKPKKKIKVWITTWLNEYRDIEVLKSFDQNHYTLLLWSKQKMNWTLLETIEREYEP